MFDQMFHDSGGTEFAKLVDATMRKFDESMDAKVARAMGLQMAKAFTAAVNDSKGEGNNFPTVFAGITMAIAAVYGECIRRMKLDEQVASAVGCTVSLMVSQYLCQVVDSLYGTSKDGAPMDSAAVVSEVEAMLGLTKEQDNAG